MPYAGAPLWSLLIIRNGYGKYCQNKNAFNGMQQKGPAEGGAGIFS
jgi:hypothetical protein